VIGAAFAEIEFDHLGQSSVLTGAMARMLDLSEAFFGAAEIPTKGLAEAPTIHCAIAVQRTRPLARTLQPVAPAVLIRAGRRVTAEELEMDCSARLVLLLGNRDRCFQRVKLRK
jgi:hypothetical protein